MKDRDGFLRLKAAWTILSSPNPPPTTGSATPPAANAPRNARSESYFYKCILAPAARRSSAWVGKATVPGPRVGPVFLAAPQGPRRAPYHSGMVSPRPTSATPTDSASPAQVLRRFRAVFNAVKTDRKSTRLNSSHVALSRMPSSA